MESQKKKMEAADIIEILKKQLAIAAGGRDRFGRPIITISSSVSETEFTLEEIIHTICYLSSLYDDSSRRIYFIIIIDLRKGVGKKLPDLLKAIQVTLYGKLNKVLLIKKEGLKFKLNVDLKKESDYLNCEILTTTISKLHQIINASQLTEDLNGTLAFDCKHWLENRLLLEQFVKQSRSSIRYIQTTLHKMNGHLQMLTKTNANEMLEQNETEFAVACQMSNAVLESGEIVLNRLEMDGDSGFRSDEIANLNLDIKDAIIQVRKCLEDVKQQNERLDQFWYSMKTNIIQMIDFEELERNIHTVVEWILGPAEDLLAAQQGVGTSFQSADESRKQHEQVELACIGIYGFYAELRHRAETMIEEENHIAGSAIEVQKDYMDTVCRSFAHRLERRRNLLITSSFFHRLIEELFQKFCNFFELLQEDFKLENYEQCKRVLDVINNMQENINVCTNQALHEGERLLDLIALPVKNASGQDVTPNFTSAVMHIKRICAQLEERKNHVDEAASVKFLRLNQIAKMLVCESEAKQAIGWIEDLCNALVTSHYLIGTNPDETMSLEEQHYAFQETAEQTYEYGRQLLHAALILRRSSKLSYEINTRLGRILHQTWRRFLVGCKEKSLRLTACLEFHLNIDRLLKEYDEKHRSRNVRLNEICRHLSQVVNTGKVLLERLKLPVISFERVDKLSYDEAAAERIQQKIDEAEIKLDEYRARRRDSEHSFTTSTSSAGIETFHTANSSTFGDDFKSLTSDEWKTAPSLTSEDWRAALSEGATSADELNEFYSADDHIDNLNHKTQAPINKNAVVCLGFATEIKEPVTVTSSEMRVFKTVTSLKQISRATLSHNESSEPILTTSEPILTTSEPILTTSEPILTTSEPILITSHQSMIEKAIQNGEESAYEREASSSISTTSRLNQDLDATLGPLINPESICGSDLTNKFESDPFIQQLKEVGEQICEMIDGIIIK